MLQFIDLNSPKKKYASFIFTQVIVYWLSLQLSSKDVESLAKFGSLLSSDMGYKNYRARVHTINPPLIPYLYIFIFVMFVFFS